MARQWQRIPLEDAKRHPLYGIKNWLAVFGFGILISPLRAVGELSNSAHEAGLTLSQALNSNTQIGTFVKADLAFNLTIAAVLLWLLFSKHRHFRLGSIALLVLQWPAYFVVVLTTGGTQIPGLGAALTTQFLSSLLLIAIWVTYLQRSRRVRVTFENSVLVEKSGQSSPRNSKMPQASNQIAPNLHDGNSAYEKALDEIEEGRLDKGTWARCFADSGGDESKAKALYIKARAESLSKADEWLDTQPPAQENDGVESREKSSHAKQQALDAGLSIHDVEYLGRPIMAIHYLCKYKMSEGRLAIACREQKIRWNKHDDILWVADEEIKADTWY